MRGSAGGQAIQEEEAAPFGAYAPTGLVKSAVAATRRLGATWLNRRLTNIVRRWAIHRLKGRPVDVETLGFRMRLMPYRNICEKRMLFSPQTFDPRELAILESRLRPGFTFIDIGANVGAYSLFVASRTDGSARILAVEPQPDIFNRLVYNVGLNAFATIKAIECAVADKPGEVTLFLDAENSGESSVKIVGSGGATPLRVMGRTLLDLVGQEGYGRLDAVKLDVEGAEDLVLGPFLESAGEALHPGLLIIENALKQWQIDLPALLVERGYRLVAETRLNFIYERIAGPPA